MFEPKSGRTDPHTFAAAASITHSSGSPAAAPGDPPAGLGETTGAVPGATVGRETHRTGITKCLFCRYRKPAARSGESAHG